MTGAASPGGSAAGPDGSPRPRLRPLHWILLLLTLGASSGGLVYRHLRAGKLGDDCMHGCRSGRCYRLNSGNYGYCSRRCSDDRDCGGRLVCRPAGRESICKRPPRLDLGQECAESDACLSGLCGAFTVRNSRREFFRQYCTVACSPTAPCPSGWTCGFLSKICEPRERIRLDAQRYFDALDMVHVRPMPMAP